MRYMERDSKVVLEMKAVLSHAADSYDHDDGCVECCDIFLICYPCWFSLWVVCVFRRIDVVNWCMLCTRLQF